MPSHKDGHLPWYLCALLGTLLPSSDCTCCANCMPCNIQVPKLPLRKMEDPNAMQTTDGFSFHVSSKKKRGRTKRFIKRSAQLVDSGASVTCCNDIKLFDTIDQWDPEAYVRVADKAVSQARAIGSITLRFVNDHGKIESFRLENVYYMPNFECNLLSTSDLWKQCKIKSVFKDRAYLKGPSGRKCYFDQAGSNLLSTYAVQPSEPGADLWHKRFMHTGNHSLARIGRRLHGFHPSKHDSSKCTACLQGGAKKQRLRRLSGFKQRRRYVYFGQRISSDLCGPFPEAINGKYKYAIVFHDSATKHISVYPLEGKTKEEVLEAFQQFLEDNKGRITKGIGEWHTDQGGEFTSKDMDTFLDELCIKRSYSIPFEPWQNPYAERTWGQLLRKIRTAFVDSQVPHTFWVYAIQFAAHIHNIIPSYEGDLSPNEKTGGQSPDYDSLRVWGCKCYYFLPKKERTKLGPRAVQAVYLGPDPQRNGHLVYVPSKNVVTAAYHVVFAEHEYVDPKLYETAELPSANIPTYVRDQPRKQKRSTVRPGGDPNCPACRGRHRKHTCGRQRDANAQPNEQNAQPDDDESSDEDVPALNDASDSDTESDEETVVRGAQVKESQPCKWYEQPPCRLSADCLYCEDHDGLCSHIEHQREFKSVRPVEDDLYEVHHIFDNVSQSFVRVCLADLGKKPIPNGFEEASISPDSERWWESMHKEITDLLRHDTWDLVSRSTLPKGRKPTKSRWVYTIKYTKDGTIERWKSRFVVCGYSQVQGFDYDRAFSATLRSTTFRTLLAMCAGNKLKVEHFDVTNAFTQADIDDVDIWVEPPKGFDKLADEHGTFVPKLKKALYGTKQASRLWQATLTEFLVKELKFVQSKSDPCLYRLEKDGDILLVGVYVDDIICAHKGKLFKWFKNKFLKRFRAKHLGPLEWFLGVAIDQHADYSISMHQTKYIENMVQKYIPHHKHNCIERSFPDPKMFEDLSRASDDEERARVSKLQYMSIIGALLHASGMCRPDIAVYVSILAKFTSDPSQKCYDAAVMLLLYLNCTKDKKIVFTGSKKPPADGSFDDLEEVITKNHGFVAYSDSSWGNKYPYPMFGYCMFMYGGVISYASKQLKVVAFSSCEAEYAAAAYACKEIEFIRHLCSDMGFPFDGPLAFCVDNTAAIDVAYNMGVSGRTKHFNMAIHYFRDCVQLLSIIPRHVLTKFQLADIFTKQLDKTNYTEQRKYFLV